MPRSARVVAVGYPHHITQRGNNKQTIFESEADFIHYLNWLRRYSKKYALTIWAYCLMPNHVHFVAVPGKPDSLALTFNALHMRYAHYFNQKKDFSGHLWQGRFFSCALDERHLYVALRYIENNPVRAGLAERPGEYEWSSAASRIYGQDKWNVLATVGLASEELALSSEATDDEDAVESIRQYTKTGYPCGDDYFVDELEQVLGAELRPRRPGRPKH